MISSDKYFQQGYLNSDENVSSLWEQLHYEQQPDSIMLAESQSRSFAEYKSEDSGNAGDFMEVWRNIEESIRYFEIAKK